MLVLARKIGERIMIDHPDGTIVLKVCEFRDGKVRIGIEAPRSVKVMREELIGDERRNHGE